MITFILYIVEAISMSDRIIVLTKRPATVKTIHDIILNKKSSPTQNRNDKNFTSYYETIWKELDSHV